MLKAIVETVLTTQHTAAPFRSLFVTANYYTFHKLYYILFPSFNRQFTDVFNKNERTQDPLRCAG